MISGLAMATIPCKGPESRLVGKYHDHGIKAEAKAEAKDSFNPHLER